MAAPHSVDPAELLEQHLAGASPDLLREMVKTLAEALMSAQADAVCGAGYGERSQERTNRRNGYRARDWDTRAGTVELASPEAARRLATSRTGCWNDRRRAEQALVSVVATAYLLGRLDAAGGEAGRAARDQGALQARRSARWPRSSTPRSPRSGTGPLDAGPYTFVWIDALTQKVREGGRTVNVHALIATGVNADGHREILGLDVASAEDGAGWLAFLRGLVARGLSGVQLVISDAHRGLVDAIGAALPGAAWQRCRTHYLRNLLTKVPKSAQPWVATLVRTIFDQPDADAVRAQFDRVVDALERQVPRRRRASRRRPRRPAGLHRLPARDLAPDLVEQPPGTAEQGDPPPHRRGRDLPRPRRDHPPGRRGAGRADRRMDRRPPLHGPGIPRQSRLRSYPPATRRDRTTDNEALTA